MRHCLTCAAPQRFRFRSDRSTRSCRCAACTPGRSLAAAAAHTSPASRTRKISGRDVLKSARAEHPGRLRSGVLRAAPQRFRFRSDRSTRSRRCAACTPGRSHAAAAAHTSPASRTRKIKDEELLKSAVLGAPVDCCPACRARHTNASDSGRTGPHVATDVSSAPGVGRMPLHRLAPRPTRRLQKCCCRRMQQRATLLGTAWVLDVR